MATRRSRSMGLVGSKLSLPAMPHMSGCRELRLPRFDHASSRQLAEIQGFERVDHAVEGVAPFDVGARGGGQTFSERGLGPQSAQPICQGARIARWREQSGPARVYTFADAADA